MLGGIGRRWEGLLFFLQIRWRLHVQRRFSTFLGIPEQLTGGGLLKYTVLIKYTGVIKYTARKPILSVEICEIKYTVFVYIFLTKKNFHQFLHKKSKNFFFDFGGPDSVRAVMGSL